jgi:hypothetical protein
MLAHKGTVEVDSIIGKGSRFRLIFPTCVPAKETELGAAGEDLWGRI